MNSEDQPDNGPSRELERLHARIRELERANAEAHKSVASAGASEMRWRSAMANAPSYILTLTRDGTILTINRLPEGRTADEILGKQVTDFLPSEAHSELDKGLEQVFQTGTPHAFENAAPGPGGMTAWYDTRLGPIIENGNVVGAVLIGTDMTARKRAEDALLESEARYRSLFDRIPVGLYRTSPAGRILAANPALTRIVGHDDCASLIGADVESLYAEPGDRQRLLKEIDEKNVAFDLEFQLRKRDGERLWVRENVRAVRDSAGAVVCYEGSLEDVTEHRRAEEGLREQRVFSTTLLEVSPIFFVAISAEGRTLMMNESMLRTLGYTKEEAVGTDYLETFVPEADREFLAGVFDKLVHSREPTLNENRVLTRAGGELLVEWHGRSVYKEDGEFDFFFGFGVDITERTRVKRALQESEERYRAVFEQAGESNVVFDPHTGFITEFNTRAHEALGYTREEFAKLGLADIEVLESSDEAERHIDAVVEQGSDRFETQHWTKGGDVRDVLVSARAIAVGERTLIASNWVDITERKRAETALRESRQMLQMVLDTIQVRVFWKDSNSVYLGCNRHFAKDAGLRSPDEIVGKDDFSLGWSEQAELYRSDDRAVIHSGTPKLDYEEPQTAPDGDQLWLRTSKIPLKDISGRIIGVLGTYEDITERKQADAVLRQTTDTLNSILRSSTEYAIAATDLDLRVVHYNPAAERMFGLRASQVLGRSVPEIHEELGVAPRRVDAALDTVIRGAKWDSELKIAGADDLARSIHVVVTPMHDEQGTSIGYVLLAQDTTARRLAEEQRDRLESQLRHSHKMQAVGQLAAGVAHDFNSLLMVILGNVELLRRRRGRLVRRSQESSAEWEQILEAIERGRSLIKKLMVFGRTQKARPQLLNVNDLITTTETMIHGILGKRIKVRLDLAADVKRISADPVQIEQVVMNLLLNARDAMPKAGTLTITTANVTVGPEDVAADPDAVPGDRVVVSVRDTGAGMSDDTRQRLFEPFFSTKPVDKGSGLGLSVVHGIVKQAGGYIDVESEPGKGSVFELLFPAVE